MRLRLCALLICAPPAFAADPLFAPVPVPEHRYIGGWEHFVGGGLASFDCDGDGLPELLAAGGENPATLLRNRSDAQVLSFVADTPDSLTEPGMIGAYPLDIDSDGIQDLAVLRVGANQLLRGGPDCTFSAFEDLGFASRERWTTAFSATWEDGNSLPTLAFGNYVDRNDPDGPFGTCDVNLLYRPDGDRYGEPAELTPGFCPLSMLFSDWSGQGRVDLRISNDRHYYVSDGAEQMWVIESPPRLLTEADGWIGHKLWGMGIAARDLDRDGQQEVLLSSMGDQRLQRRSGDGAEFTDVPYEMGTTAHRPYEGDDGRPSTGWHVAFGDVNNDGLDDIFISKGNVDQMPDAAQDDPNNLLMHLPDGRFAEFGGSAGIASPHRGRGAVLADLNADGRLDLAVVNRRAPLEIWQNVTPVNGHWLSIALEQPGPNRHAVGAWIEVISEGGGVQRREITVGGGHAGGRAGFQHFGLGQSDRVGLQVIWPNGSRSNPIETVVNRAVTLFRGPEGLLLRP